MVAVAEVCLFIFFCFCFADEWMDVLMCGDRYNTFYVLYPIGITSECTLAVKALAGAQELHPLYYWFIVAVLLIYVPGMLALVLKYVFGLFTNWFCLGSYVMYTHMIKQKGKTAGAKKEGKREGKKE